MPGASPPRGSCTLTNILTAFLAGIPEVPSSRPDLPPFPLGTPSPFSLGDSYPCPATPHPTQYRSPGACPGHPEKSLNLPPPPAEKTNALSSPPAFARCAAAGLGKPAGTRDSGRPKASRAPSCPDWRAEPAKAAALARAHASRRSSSQARVMRSERRGIFGSRDPRRKHAQGGEAHTQKPQRTAGASGFSAPGGTRTRQAPRVHAAERLGLLGAQPLPCDPSALQCQYPLPSPPRPAPPLTSDPVSADPQLDINSRSPESQPGEASGARVGARSPAQQVGGKSSQSGGPAGRRGRAGGGGQGSRGRREEGEGGRQCPRQPSTPPEVEIRAAAPALGGGRHGCACSTLRGAARAGDQAGDSAAAASLCASSGRRAGEHKTGRADAAAGAEIWPGNPNETPRQPARGVP
ncbi:PREDICTED: treacle protein-like [Elephantulus edwardii]|uniref:treacle protein-like n=1 Tax=Elephantulus edwardii TaxID=28737 RepID=UPI0003F09BCA|nr:PREDICTED: treacle protein-like [Elephantulus edwardii]